MYSDNELRAACAKARADERQRWLRGIVRTGTPRRGDTHVECWVPLDLLDDDDDVS